MKGNHTMKITSALVAALALSLAGTALQAQETSTQQPSSSAGSTTSSTTMGGQSGSTMGGGQPGMMGGGVTLDYIAMGVPLLTGIGWGLWYLCTSVTLVAGLVGAGVAILCLCVLWVIGRIIS
jgi:hypothetical protein